MTLTLAPFGSPVLSLLLSGESFTQLSTGTSDYRVPGKGKVWSEERPAMNALAG